MLYPNHYYCVYNCVNNGNAGQLGIGNTNNIGDTETPGTLGLTVQIGSGPTTPVPTPGLYLHYNNILCSYKVDAISVR
jgi:hypothetical protein